MEKQYYCETCGIPVGVHKRFCDNCARKRKLDKQKEVLKIYKEVKIKESIKKEKIDSIPEVEAKARAAGMKYGDYVSKTEQSGKKRAH